MRIRSSLTIALLAITPSIAFAQAVCLPSPRLLTTMPMGGKAGTTVEVTITGDQLENIEELSFSHDGITAKPKVDDKGSPIPNQFVVTIAADCPPGIHEARVMTRLGVSSSRVFSVGTLPETTRQKSNTTLQSAVSVQVNSICNATLTSQAIDYYSFEARQGQRIIVECAAQGIESKMKPVVIIADKDGSDLLVERRGGVLDFSVPESGRYVIKVNDLTYNGGPYYFYRLAVTEAAADAGITRQPATRSVSSFSWPPEGVPVRAAVTEVEPNNQHDQAQKIRLPCDIAGRFFPAADVDTFEFTAKKGDVWWVEVASERLGLPTDPSIVVQHIGENGKLTDVVELSDIPSPVKVSSNGYSYDGPPYNAGSTDILGKVEIKQDGVHRLQLRDLFGGTRKDPRNVYRLIIRKAAPDFALVGWGLHMNLRNGDRNCLSKPMSLRGGATMALEVVTVRRDGFNGEIHLSMDNLPEGVTATGLKIASGKSRGIMLITAAPDAARGLSSASFTGQATIDGKQVIRPCRLASMKWPVRDQWSEIPNPRLLADVPVSVCGGENAPLTIAARGDSIREAIAGEKLTIPLVHTRRSEFSGLTIGLKNWNSGLGSVPTFEASLKEDGSEAVVDLAALKTPPGEYVLAFYGSAVAKYRYNLEAVSVAEDALKQAKQQVETLAAAAGKLADDARTASKEKKAEADRLASEAAEKQKAAQAAVVAAEKRLKDVTARSQPKDIVDIVVSTPITIRVKPAEPAN